MFGTARAWFLGVARKLDHYGQRDPSPLVEAVLGRSILGQQQLASTLIFSSIRLEDVGISGNSHMMMLEKNNDVVIKFITDWLQKNVLAASTTSTK